MTKFNARQFAKHGFKRDERNDFTDDGARFKSYEYKGVQVTYTTYTENGVGYVYIASHIDYHNSGIDSSDFFDNLRSRNIDLDCYNGVVNDKDEIDLDYLKKQIDLALEMIDELVDEYSNEPISKEADYQLGYEIDFLVKIIDFIEDITWYKYDKRQLGNMLDNYEYFCNKLKALQAIDRNDAHNVNLRVKKYGYIESNDVAKWYEKQRNPSSYGISRLKEVYDAASEHESKEWWIDK